MNTQINKLAKKNRYYYLKEREIDEHKDFWFKYIKDIGCYSEPVSISPAMAKELLDSKVKGGRSKSGAIALDYAGQLIDGFERVESIASSKKPVVAFVFFNVVNKGERFYAC